MKSILKRYVCNLLSIFLLSGSANGFSETSIIDYPEMRFTTPFDNQDRARQELGGVNAIVQDKLGFIWIGGENGLARYDGRTLLYFKSDLSGDGSLPLNYIFQMVVDSKNTLWLATEEGLIRYDIGVNRFERVTTIGSFTIDVDSVSALEIDANDQLYVGTARGLYVIDPSQQHMRFFLPRPPLTIEPNIEQIRDILIDDKKNVWLATAGMGVAVLNPNTEKFNYFLHNPQDSGSLGHNSVRSVLQDSRGRIWFGTYGNGVSRLDAGSEIFQRYVYNADVSGSIGGNIIWDIKEDAAGNILFAIDQRGLARFDEESEHFVHYRHRPYDLTSLVSDQLRVIYEDNNNDLWFGASPSGVSFYSRNTNKFRHFITQPSDPFSLSNNSILRIIEAADGMLWVGTEGGLNRLDPATGKVTRYLANPTDPAALRANAVLALEEDSDGQIWVGTWGGGLHRLNPHSGIFSRYFPNPSESGSINSEFIWDITKDRNDNIWIATETGGLNRYEKSTDSFIHYYHDPKIKGGITGNFISSLMADSKGNLWLGGYTGVNVFNLKNETFTQIPYETGFSNSTNSKNTKAFFEDSKGRVWIGTQHRGVNIFDTRSKEFRYLDTSDGLPSQNVSGILEDDNQNIWLATGNGLVKIDSLSEKITIFGREAELAGSNYNREALLKDRNGRLYFGSSEGITSFHPAELRSDSAPPPIRLVSFRIFNKEVNLGENSPLKVPIFIADKISLSYKDSMFTFGFSALDYRNSKTIHYSYKLDGFDQDWIDVGRNANAVYTNLGPGKYTFRVRASNDDEHWYTGQSLEVRIQAPPWRTWWAYVLYVIIIFSALYYRHSHIVLRANARAYQAQATKDALTGVYNRFGLGQIAEGVFSNSETKRGVGVALFDVDHFKLINDRCGHDSGDYVLKNVARIAKDTIRHSDHFGRWGGEEFVLICVVRDPEDGMELIDKVRIAIREFNFGLDGIAKVTVSAGFAMVSEVDSFESALKRADTAMYEAKKSGRDRIVLASPKE
ncbi:MULTISPECIES: ligand-binding sensor domain-containing diguanylate cyclase [unclassified Cellvibrio]|uniref:ligand-binding sensor domain-containing diguanylate cyclase n=1 Tax=unclassified Cellvibrio TaxID=2624793 RepID=UPI00078301A2|nr:MULTISPECIES: ligand-binding sensor domain-containing diguanylate cyclase [unclassified Cellvibrio]